MGKVRTCPRGFACTRFGSRISTNDCLDFISFIRIHKQCDDPIIIYTGYNRDEDYIVERAIRKYDNIIIKWGRYIMGHKSHYDKILGVNLASDNQYAELIK